MCDFLLHCFFVWFFFYSACDFWCAYVVNTIVLILKIKSKPLHGHAPIWASVSWQQSRFKIYDLWYLLSVITTFSYQMMQMNGSNFLIESASYRNLFDTNSTANNIKNVFPSVSVKIFKMLGMNSAWYWMVIYLNRKGSSSAELEFIWKTSKQAKSYQSFLNSCYRNSLPFPSKYVCM